VPIVDIVSGLLGKQFLSHIIPPLCYSYSPRHVEHLYCINHW
jgi:hypothetical protein